MNQYNKTFLNLLRDYAPQSTALSKEESQNLCALVEAKAGIQSKRLRKGYKTLLIAAIVSAMLMVAAAASFGVSDIFRGVLRELDPTGRIVPLSSMSRLVESTGKLIGETVSAYGLDVTVRGVIGSANTIMLMVEIEDTDGAPIGLEQADGTLSRETIQFGRLTMRTEETLGNRKRERNGFGDEDIQIGASGMSGRIESYYTDDTDSKVTLLISVEAETHQPLNGKTLYLTLRDLGQYGFLRGTEAGLEAGRLSDLVTRFPPVSDGDFVDGGEERDDKGEVTKRYYNLEKNTDIRVPLAPGLPEYYVTNAAVRYNTLYLNGVRTTPEGSYDLVNEIRLYNPRTEQYIYGSNSWNSKEWYMQFYGVESIEDLRDYVVVIHGGEGLHPIREGVWEFEVPLDYEDVTRVLELNQDFTAPDGFTMHIRRITVSPYYLSMDVSLDKAEFERMLNQHHAVTLQDLLAMETGMETGAVITMKDGVQVIAPTGGSGGGANDYTMRFHMEAVIDPKQIKSISFGDLTVDCG